MLGTSCTRLSQSCCSFLIIIAVSACPCDKFFTLFDDSEQDIFALGQTPDFGYEIQYDNIGGVVEPMSIGPFRTASCNCMLHDSLFGHWEASGE
jgi:hypothetical protein